MNVHSLSSGVTWVASFAYTHSSLVSSGNIILLPGSTFSNSVCVATVVRGSSSTNVTV